MLVVNSEVNVLTTNGYKPVNKLVLGDSLISRDCGNLVTNFDISEIKVCKPIKLRKIVTEESSICVHPNTLVLCKKVDKWTSSFIESSEVREGDLIGLNIERNSIEPVDMNLGIKLSVDVDDNNYVSKQYIDNSLYEKAASDCFWWLCGMYLRYGRMNKGVAEIVVVKNPDAVISVLKELGINYYFNSNGFYHHIIIADKAVCKFFGTHMGDSYMKFVHPIFMQLPKSKLRAFVECWRSILAVSEWKDDAYSLICENDQVAYSLQVCMEQLYGVYPIVEKDDKKQTYLTINMNGKDSGYEPLVNTETEQFWTKITEISDMECTNSIEITCINAEKNDAVCYVNNFVLR